MLRQPHNKSNNRANRTGIKTDCEFIWCVTRNSSNSICFRSFSESSKSSGMARFCLLTGSSGQFEFAWKVTLASEEDA